MPSAREIRSVLATVAEEFDRIYAELVPIGARFATLTDRYDRITREQLATLRPMLFAMLATHRELVAGTGVFTVPGLLADADHWLEWWWTRPSGSPEALRVNLDPAAPDFFDYTTADWYATPLATSQRHVAGPYVDYACTNQYALTVALPIGARRGLVGIAAADVLITRLEERVLPTLRNLQHPAVLVNSRGRVVVSSSPDYAPGELLVDGSVPAGATAGRRRSQAEATTGWQVLGVPARAR